MAAFPGTCCSPQLVIAATANLKKAPAEGDVFFLDLSLYQN
jgi:hypothetical protein